MQCSKHSWSGYNSVSTLYKVSVAFVVDYGMMQLGLIYTYSLLFFHRKTAGLFDFEEVYIDDVTSVKYSGFKVGAPVKIIIHGFMSSAFVGPAVGLRAGNVLSRLILRH